MFISLKSKKEIYKPKKISTTTKIINSKLKKKKILSLVNQFYLKQTIWPFKKFEQLVAKQ